MKYYAEYNEETNEIGPAISLLEHRRLDADSASKMKELVVNRKLGFVEYKRLKENDQIPMPTSHLVGDTRSFHLEVPEIVEKQCGRPE